MAGNAGVPAVHCASGEEATQADSAYRDYRDLKPLGRKKDVRDFLKDIHKAFVQKVDVQQSGLLDALIALGILNDSDTQSLSAAHLPTPKEKARRLWKILNGIDHKIFIDRVLPVLCRLYGFIIPEKYWKDGQSHASTAERDSNTALKERAPCTRCAVRNRLRPADLADFLFQRGVITPSLYNHLTSNVRTSPPDWSTIFSAFIHLQRFSAFRHAPGLARILREHALHVPDESDLAELMLRGFPCSCRNQEGVKTVRAKRLRLSLFSLRRPSADSNASETSSVFPQSEYSDDGSDRTSVISGVSVTSSHCDDASAGVRRDGPIAHPELSPVAEAPSFEEGRDSGDTLSPCSPTTLATHMSGEHSGTAWAKDGSEDTATPRHIPSKLCKKHATFPRAFRETMGHQQPLSHVRDLSPQTPATRRMENEILNIQPQSTGPSEKGYHKQTVEQTRSAGATSSKSESDEQSRFVSTSAQTDAVDCPRCCLECDSTNFEVNCPVQENTGCRQTREGELSMNKRRNVDSVSVETGEDASRNGQRNVDPITARAGAYTRQPEPGSNRLSAASDFEFRNTDSTNTGQPEPISDRVSDVDTTSEPRSDRESPASDFEFRNSGLNDSATLQDLSITGTANCGENFECGESAVPLSDYEAAERNNDIPKLCDIVQREVPDTEALVSRLQSISLTDAVSERTLNNLIADYSQQENMLRKIAQNFGVPDTSRQSPDSDFHQHFTYIIGQCSDLLLKKRAYILCRMELCSQSTQIHSQLHGPVRTHSTQTSAACSGAECVEMASKDLLLLIEASLYDVYARVNSLTNLDDSRHDVEWLKTFQGKVIKILGGF